MSTGADKLKVDAVAYDFDGTLYDSFEGINSAFKKTSLLVHSVEVELNKKDIGPQLIQLYENAFGKNKRDAFLNFQQHFRHFYDNVCYNDGQLYPRTVEVLDKFYKSGIKQYIVSNKPQKVLEKILLENNIDKYFIAVSGHPTGGATLNRKSDRLMTLLKRELINPENLLLVGDTIEDLEMADTNKCRFVHAAYGYGTVEKKCLSVSRIDEILNFITHDKGC